MAAENFERIMDEVFRHEGGYVDHPRDPGGATNFGITIGTLRAWRGKAVTKTDVRNLTKVEARAIYRKNYWDKVCGDDLPGGVDYCVMDSAVNSGPARAARWLQSAVGANPDGAIGTRTLAAADAADPVVTVQRMCDARMAFLRGLGTWSTFGTGWTRRINSVRSLALTLAHAEKAKDAAIAPVDPAPEEEESKVPPPVERDPSYPLPDGSFKPAPPTAALPVPALEPFSRAQLYKIAETAIATLKAGEK